MDPEAAKIPESLMHEVRSRLASLGIKMTLASDMLAQETDARLAQDLREQIALLKEEARLLAERYNLAKGALGHEREEPAAAAGGAALDDVLVFADLAEVTGVVAPVEAPVADLDDVELVYDLAGGAEPPTAAPRAPEVDAVVLDEVALTFSIDEVADAPAAPPSARGGRLGMALGIAVEEAGRRTAPWGVPLAAVLLETAALALERGADDEEAAAAALFAAIDEPREELQLGAIREALGERVVALVAWSAWISRVDPWQQRDRAYVAKMQQAPPAALMATLCGRLVATRAAHRQLAAHGPASLDWGGLPRDRYFWNMRMLVKAYRAAGHALVVGPLVDAWVREVAALDDATGGGAFEGPSGPLA